jgi:hypothetical protein
LVRGFYGPDPGGRWTRRQAWLRIVPSRPAQEQRVTLWMDFGPPSPLAEPEVVVRVGRDEPVVFRPGQRSAPYELRARVAANEPVLVEIETSTWSAIDVAPEQGVRIHRVCVVPVQSSAQ